jgi:hypothetical protein
MILKTAREVLSVGGAKRRLVYVDIHQPLNRRVYREVVDETHWLYSCKLGTDTLLRIQGGEL